MSDEWKPDGEDVEDYFALGAVEYKVGERGLPISEAHDAYRAWLAAHDRALREQIARDIEARRNEPGQIELADRFGGYHAGQSAGLDLAARIARGEGSE